MKKLEFYLVRKTHFPRHLLTESMKRKLKASAQSSYWLMKYFKEGQLIMPLFLIGFPKMCLFIELI